MRIKSFSAAKLSLLFGEKKGEREKRKPYPIKYFSTSVNVIGYAIVKIYFIAIQPSSIRTWDTPKVFQTLLHTKVCMSEFAQRKWSGKTSIRATRALIILWCVKAKLDFSWGSDLEESSDDTGRCFQTSGAELDWSYSRAPVTVRQLF